MARRIALALGLIALCALQPACQKKAREPSAHYDKGSKIHQDLYVRQLDDAYLDPRMDDAVAQLKQVPAESIDFDGAQELLATIKKGRDEATKQKIAHEKEQAELQRGITSVSAIDPSAVLKSSAAAAAAGAANPGDPAPSDPFAPGASIADLNQKSGGCLVPGMPFTEEGSHTTGTTYKVAASQACKDKLPGFVGEVLLVTNGRIYRRVPEADLRQTEVKVPGAQEPAPPSSAAAPAATEPVPATAPSKPAAAPAAAPAPKTAATAPAPAPDVSTPATNPADVTTGQVDPGSKAP